MTSSFEQGLSIVGKTGRHGRSHLFGIKQSDRLGHLWMLGKTGTGKSTLLAHLIASELQANRGLMVTDPHGDLVETILHLVPPSRVADTMYFDPADTAYPFALNPLDPTAGLSAPLLTSALLSVLKKAWPEFWGPRLEYVWTAIPIAQLHLIRHKIKDLDALRQLVVQLQELLEWLQLIRRNWPHPRRAGDDRDGR